MSSSSPLDPNSNVNAIPNLSPHQTPPPSPENQNVTSAAKKALDNQVSDNRQISSSSSSSVPLSLMNDKSIPLQLSNQLENSQLSKLLLPGVSLCYENANDLKMVSARVIQDQQDMGAAAVSLHHLRNNPMAVITKCLTVLRGTEHLFTDQTALERRVSAHVNKVLTSQTDDVLLRDIGFDPVKLRNNEYTPTEVNRIKEVAITSMSRNLADYCYHTINHAKEMFYDTFVKLTLKDHPEHLVLEGATNAFLHDLIQCLGGFSSMGQNENVTANIIGSITQEVSESLGIGSDLIKASRDLSNATIVGGTLLVDITRGQGVEKRALTHVVDERHFLADATKGTAEDRRFVCDLRDVAADNDINRTGQAYDEIVPFAGCSTLTFAIFEERNRAVRASQQAIHEECPQLEALSSNATTSRVLQSIRMSGELRYKWRNTLPPRTSIINYYANQSSVTPQQQESIRTFVSTINWGNEVDFANKSDQRNYADFISSDPFKRTMSALEPEAQSQLFKLALTDGQAGHHMHNPSQVIERALSE